MKKSKKLIAMLLTLLMLLSVLPTAAFAADPTEIENGAEVTVDSPENVYTMTIPEGNNAYVSKVLKGSHITDEYGYLFYLNNEYYGGGSINFGYSFTISKDDLPKGSHVIEFRGIKGYGEETGAKAVINLTVKGRYTITNACLELNAETNNGYLTVDKTDAYATDTVTVTVNPAGGYALKADSLKVTYNDGSQDQTILPGRDEEDATKYTFEMPDFAVTVSADFEKIHVHSLTEVPTCSATCTESGVKSAYWVCSGDDGCGKYFTAATDGTEISTDELAANYIEAAKGHTYGDPEAKWEGDMCTATRTCTVCAEGTENHSISETKQGTYVKDTDATCLAAETGHYEVTFDDAQFGSAQTDANTVSNGNPIEHSYTGEVRANNDGTHSFQCVNGCGEYGGTVECVDELGDGYCDICGATLDPLAQDRADAIAKLEALVNGNDNKEVQKMLASYVDQINNASSLNEINSIVAKATSALKQQIEIANEGSLVSAIRALVNLCDHNHQKTTNKVMGIIKPILGLFGIR